MILLGYGVLLLLWTCCSAQNDCKTPPPRRRKEILTETWNKESYPHGTRATYVCRPGYIKLGRVIFQCNNGIWQHAPPYVECQNKPCGHPGDIPFGSFDLTEGTEFVFGARVEYRCDDGYRMLSQRYVRECLADGWSNDLPHCEVIKCLPVTAPENGRIAMSGTYEMDQEFSFGQAIRFECNADYKLKGDKEIYCSATGDWSQEVPQCIEVTCTPPVILNGEVMVPRRLYKEKERIQFNCDTGFKFNERSDAVCTEDGWTPAPLCIEVTCDHPKVADGSFVPSKTIYREEDVITVDCKRGFHFDSFSGNTAQCTKNGWIPVPKCVLRPCDYPQVENIELSGYYQSNRERAFPAQIGSSVYYSCANGYVTATEQNWVLIRCTRDGWDPAPKCIKICYAPNVENGGTGYRSWRKFRQGETISYSCHRAYLPENEQGRITCTKNGWSPTPRCVPENVTCGPPPEVVNADIIHTDNEMHLPGTRVQYKCHRGFQIVGSNQVICENREWSQLPTCQDVTCGSPPDIVGGWIADTKRERYFPGEIIRYRCRQGQTLSGPARVVCKEGNWSPLGTPECSEGSGRCGPPPIIENGDITTFPLSHYERHSTVKYKCKHLYILEGSEYARCDSGQWTDPPTCIEPCAATEQDMAENNIRLKWVSGEKLYSASGDVIEFDCIHGYVRDPASPPFRVQCQEGKLLYPRCGSRAPAGTSV